MWASAARWLLLFGILFGLRFAVALVIDSAIDVDKNVDVYATVADNIARGNGFVAVAGEPMLWRTPAYPYFLAALFGLFGEMNESAVLVAQAALDAGTGVLVFVLGRAVFGFGAGLLAALSFSLYPLSAYYALRMLPEPLFTLALTATVAALVWALRANTMGRYLWVGLLGGVTTLVKPVTLLIGPVIGAYMVARNRGHLRGVAPLVAVMLVASAAVVTPWTIRNWLVTGHFIPVATGGGFSLWVGNNLITGGIEEVEGPALLALDERIRAISASARGASPSDAPAVASTAPGHEVNISYEVDRAFMREALRQMAEHPVETLAIMARKVFRLWFSIGRIQNQWAQIYITIAQACLLLLAGVGVLHAVRRRVVVWPLLLPALYLVIVHALTFSTLRYSVPVMPVAIIFAAGGALDLLVRIGERAGFRPPAWLRDYDGR